MVTKISFIQVFIESFERLVSNDLELAEIPVSGIIIMIVTVVVKLFVRFHPWCALSDVRPG